MPHATDRRIKIVRTYDGELHALITYPASVGCLPLPDAFRAIEEGLVDAQGQLEDVLTRRAG